MNKNTGYSMKRETIKLVNGSVKVLLDGDLIYLDVFGEYTDDDAIVMTKFLENLFIEIGGPTIRVWDGTNMSKNGFKLTSEGTDKFAEWSRRMNKEWPGNIIYFIADKPLKYGVSRMYEMKASDDNVNIKVVHGIDELPDSIKARILPTD